MTGFRDSVVWKTAKRIAIDPVRRAAVRVAYRDRVPLMWCEGRNFGDALSPVLARLLSGKRVVHVEGLHHHRYLAVGSILGSANERAEVWGSGFIREDESVIAHPRAVHAVRGPLTREALLKQGVDCHEVYGDPALLLPRFFNPTVSRRYSVGLIPHYIDKKHPWIRKFQTDPAVRVLDIEAGIDEFIREVKSCDVILSSSLHGQICADAYGIPSAWMKLSDMVVGGAFKFSDYTLSIGAPDTGPVVVTDTTSLTNATRAATQRPLRIDLRKLLEACPFLSDDLRKELEASTPHSCGLPSALGAGLFEKSMRAEHLA